MIVVLVRARRATAGWVAGRRVAGRREAGFVEIWVPIMTLVVLALTVLIVDGGAKISAATTAGDDAGQAARAAVIAAGPLTEDPSAGQRALAAARAYFAAADLRGTAFMTGPQTVIVTVTISGAGPISGVHFTMSRSATAHLLVGTDAGTRQ